MSTLTIRLPETAKAALDEAAQRIGFHRMKEGELRGDITALLTMLARALPDKSAAQIGQFLCDTEGEKQDNKPKEQPSMKQPKQDNQDLMNTEQVCELLDIAPTKLQKLINAKKIAPLPKKPAYHINYRRQFVRSKIEQFAAEYSPRPASPQRPGRPRIADGQALPLSAPKTIPPSTARVSLPWSVNGTDVVQEDGVVVAKRRGAGSYAERLRSNPF